MNVATARSLDQGVDVTKLATAGNAQAITNILFVLVV
jgi:hypothetical protein